MCEDYKAYRDCVEARERISPTAYAFRTAMGWGLAIVCIWLLLGFLGFFVYLGALQGMS